MFHSARIKLTLWYLLIIMTISVLFSLVIYRVQSGESARVLERQRTRIEIEGYLPPGFPPHPEPAILVESQNRMKLNLFLINLAVLVISGGAAYFLAGRSLKPIEEMVEDQKRFVADASHELRTPLTTMKTEMEVNLRSKSLGKEAKKLLESNLEEVNKLSYLSDKLLRLNRYEHGTEMPMEKISLKGILEETTEKIATSAKAKKIEITQDLKETAVQGNGAALVEAFGTILDNAIKYSPKGSKINVGLKSKDGKAIVTIQDFGIGIAADDIPHIFNRFYRADTSPLGEKVSGFGLGLSIAKTIIDRHKGKIEVESTPDHGSTFTVELPIAS